MIASRSLGEWESFLADKDLCCEPVREGDEVSPYYDPMLAKVIVHGADRAEAATKLSAALDKARAVAYSRPT